MTDTDSDDSFSSEDEQENGNDFNHNSANIGSEHEHEYGYEDEHDANSFFNEDGIPFEDVEADGNRRKPRKNSKKIEYKYGTCLSISKMFVALYGCVCVYLVDV